MITNYTNEGLNYTLTGESKDINVANEIIEESYHYAIERFQEDSDPVKQKSWNYVISKLNVFIKTICLEEAERIIENRDAFSETELDRAYNAVYEKYSIIEMIVSDFPVKRENPIKAKDRRDYDKSVDSKRFFFYVSGMDDKSTKAAYELIAAIFEEMKQCFEEDNDIRWIYISEGIREVLKRNNLLAKNILKYKDLFANKHIRHLMNEIRKNDENPVFINEDDVAPEPVKESPVEEAPVEEIQYDFTIHEEEKVLKSYNGIVDAIWKQMQT